MRCAALGFVISTMILTAPTAGATRALDASTAKSAAASNVAGGLHSLRAYAHRLVLARWHSESEWRALEGIVDPESAWNPCASWGSNHDCRYAGSNSCGIPQANPCPAAWRGRLWETRFAQVRWIVDYVLRRYGSPSRALSFRLAKGWY